MFESISLSSLFSLLSFDPSVFLSILPLPTFSVTWNVDGVGALLPAGWP